MAESASIRPQQTDRRLDRWNLKNHFTRRLAVESAPGPVADLARLP
jgi:hypothetical protein